MTEAASQIAANPLERSERRPGSVGRPIGLELRVVGLDDSSRACDRIGAVEIRGANVIDSYLGRGRSIVPARTAAGWLRTGDLGRLDADGFLYLVGRTDEVINRGGEKAFPREIEEVLRQHPRVLDAAVVARPHPVLGEEPIAYIIAARSPDADNNILREELLLSARQRLSRFKQPASIIFLDALPKGPTGKVLRRELAALTSGTPEVGVSRQFHRDQRSASRKESIT
jgi:oxalate---CoA ligase